MMKLYIKECRRMAASIVYFLFVAILVLSWFQSFRGVTMTEINRANGSGQNNGLDRPLLAQPLKTDEFYGTKIEEDPEKIMCGMVDTLLREYRNNSYTTYPLGYYKSVSLDDNEQNRILEILCEITGLTENQLNNLPEDFFPAINGTIIHPNGYTKDGNGDIVVGNVSDTESADEVLDKTKRFVSQVSYDRFKELLTEVESITEGGYYYSLDVLEQYFGLTEMSYDEAVEEYHDTVKNEKITIPFARLFCDYMGLALGLYPIFIVVVMWLKDHMNNAAELIYSRKVSSFKLVLSRYFASITMVLIPVVLLSLESLIPLISFGVENGISVDYFAYIKYIFWWLLPTVMAVCAVGMFFTLLTDSPIAIALQFLWWLIDKGVTGLSGDTSITTLMVRHNTLRGYDIIQDGFEAICVNRAAVTGVSVLLVILSVWILGQKRKGRINAANIYVRYLGNIKNKFSFSYKK